MATATAEKAQTQDTQSRLEAAQARIETLQAEASGLPRLMQQALRDGKSDEYLRLMVRENQLPRELAEAETDVRSLRLQRLQERYEALAAEEPVLRAKHVETVQRNRERIAAIEAESEAVASAYFANASEARMIEQELQMMGEVVS